MAAQKTEKGHVESNSSLRFLYKETPQLQIRAFMSRLQHFKRGVATGYLTLGANLLFTLGSVPLSLHYLSAEEFALWALIVQIAGYLALVDFGMNVSVQRILADHKDDPAGGIYGSILKTGQLVFIAQGLVLVGAAWLLRGVLADALRIGGENREQFATLLSLQCGLLAIGGWSKILSAPFWCHQRYDVLNNAGTVSFIVNYLGLWLSYRAGLGLKSFLVGNAAALVLITVWHGVAGWRLGLFPSPGAWGRLDGRIFRELASFGRDIFFMSLGAQLLSASQVIIVSRTLGLEAAAVWAICTKSFTLAQQVTGKLFEFSTGGFVEMIVRKETHRLGKRFHDIVVLTASVSVLVAVIGATANGAFIDLWTRGRISWLSLNDTLMAAMLVVYAVARCYSGLVGLTKDLKVLRYIYFLEGLSFFLAAWWSAPRWGFSGIIVTGLAATICWSGLYGFRQVGHVLSLRPQDSLGWFLPPIKLLLLLAPTAYLVGLFTISLPSGPRFFVQCAVLGLVGVLALLWVGVPSALREEMQQHWRGRRNPPR